MLLLPGPSQFLHLKSIERAQGCHELVKMQKTFTICLKQNVIHWPKVNSNLGWASTMLEQTHTVINLMQNGLNGKVRRVPAPLVIAQPIRIIALIWRKKAPHPDLRQMCFVFIPRVSIYQLLNRLGGRHYAFTRSRFCEHLLQINILLNHELWRRRIVNSCMQWIISKFFWGSLFYSVTYFWWLR